MMKKNEVKIGNKYLAKVSGKIVEVRIERISPYGGWEATNISTGRRIRVKTGARLKTH